MSRLVSLCSRIYRISERAFQKSHLLRTIPRVFTPSDHSVPNTFLSTGLRELFLILFFVLFLLTNNF